MQPLTPEQVRAIIERAGQGETFRQKLASLTARLAATQNTLYRHARHGAPTGALGARWMELGAEFGLCNPPAPSDAKRRAHRRALGSGPVFEIRQKLDMTQEDFAKAVKLSRLTIARAERDGDYPKSLLAQDAILKLAREGDAMPSNIL